MDANALAGVPPGVGQLRTGGGREGDERDERDEMMWDRYGMAW